MGNQAWGGQNIIKQIDGFVLIFLPQKNNQYNCLCFKIEV